MTTSTFPRFVIVGFDGLRPQDVNAQSMPSLHSFLSCAHVWSHYYADFPTETYVNHPSIFSGFRPGQHGLIANAYWRRAFAPSKAFFAGWNVGLVESHESMGGLLEVPTLGERLAAKGKTLRIYCANSPGSTRLQHVKAQGASGHLVACVHDYESALPLTERQTLLSQEGPGTPLSFPDYDGTQDVVDAFFERELKRPSLADVTVLWMGEPDHSSHEFGLQASQTNDARLAADAAFSRIYEWWKVKGRAQGIQLVAISDHGHATVARHTDYEAILRDAGLRVARGAHVNVCDPSQDLDAIIVGDYVCGLWLTREGDRATLLRARDALAASPDIGLLFSGAPAMRSTLSIEGLVPGTFSEALLGTSHARTPDLRFVGRGDLATGTLTMGSSLPIGTSNHGGLLPEETHALLAIAGDAFASAEHHTCPATHVDFATTLMTLLDVAPILSPAPTGRLLKEALGHLPTAPAHEEVLTLHCGPLTQRLHRLHYEGMTYVTKAYRL